MVFLSLGGDFLYEGLHVQDRWIRQDFLVCHIQRLQSCQDFLVIFGNTKFWAFVIHFLTSQQAEERTELRVTRSESLLDSDH